MDVFIKASKGHSRLSQKCGINTSTLIDTNINQACSSRHELFSFVSSEPEEETNDSDLIEVEEELDVQSLVGSYCPTESVSPKTG